MINLNKHTDLDKFLPFSSRTQLLNSTLEQKQQFSAPTETIFYFILLKAKMLIIQMFVKI